MSVWITACCVLSIVNLPKIKVNAVKKKNKGASECFTRKKKRKKNVTVISFTAQGECTGIGWGMRVNICGYPFLPSSEDNSQRRTTITGTTGCKWRSLLVHLYRRLGLFNQGMTLCWSGKTFQKVEGYSGPDSRDASGRTQQISGTSFKPVPFLRYVTTVPQSLLLIIDPLATIDVNIVDHRRLYEAGSWKFLNAKE